MANATIAQYEEEIAALKGKSGGKGKKGGKGGKGKKGKKGKKGGNSRAKRANQAIALLKHALNMPLPQVVLRVELVQIPILLKMMVVAIAEQQITLQTTVDDLRNHLMLTSLSMILLQILRAGMKTLGGMNRGMRAGTKQIQLLITALGIRV